MTPVAQVMLTWLHRRKAELTALPYTRERSLMVEEMDRLEAEVVENIRQRNAPVSGEA